MKFIEGTNTRRLRTLRITTSTLLNLVGKCEDPTAEFNVSQFDVPEGTKIHTTWFDYSFNCFFVLIEHESFAEVPEDMIPPSFVALIKKVRAVPVEGLEKESPRPAQGNNFWEEGLRRAFAPGPVARELFFTKTQWRDEKNMGWIFGECPFSTEKINEALASNGFLGTALGIKCYVTSEPPASASPVGAANILCDECGATAVNQKLSRPLSEVNGPNNTRWHEGVCGECGKTALVTCYADLAWKNSAREAPGTV